MTESRPDASTAWVRQLVRTKPARISWQRVGLAAFGITVPAAIGLALEPYFHGAAVLGTLAAMGAMVGAITDVGAAGAQRVVRVGLTSVMATAGFAVGTLVYGHAAWTLAVVVFGALVSGLAGTISATASKAGLYLLVYLVTAANADFGVTPVWLAPLAFGAGAAWRLLLTTVAAAAVGVTLSPERRAVADVYAALATQLDVADSAASADRASSELTSALNDAYDVLVAAETSVAQRDARWQRLVAVLNAAAPVVDAAIAMTTAGTRADDAVVAWLRGVAAWVRAPGSPAPLPAAPSLTAPPSVEEAALAEAVARAQRLLSELAQEDRRDEVDAGALPEKASVRQLLRHAERSLASGRERWVAVLRLVLCMAVAQWLSLALHLDRPYMVMLAVAQVMKPELGSVFARAVQRGVGTFIGVGVGSVAIVLLPHGWWQLVAVFVFAAAIPIVMPRNYGLYTATTMPLAVILVEMHAHVSEGLVESRLLDTVLGCAIVLVLGYALWPSTWRAPRQLGAGVADLARSIAAYIGVAAAPQGSLSEAAADTAGGAHSRTAARRSIYRSVSALRSQVAQQLAEPPPISAAAAAWLPVIAALERVTDAVTTAAATADVSHADADADDVAAAQAALGDLATSIETGQAPGDDPVPSHGALAGVGDEITSARSAAAERLDVARAHRSIGFSPRAARAAWRARRP